MEDMEEKDEKAEKAGKEQKREEKRRGSLREVVRDVLGDLLDRALTSRYRECPECGNLVRFGRRCCAGVASPDGWVRDEEEEEDELF